MYSDSQAIFKTSLRAKPGKLLAIWLFLIILPFTALTIISEIILSQSEEKLALQAKLKLCHELQDFRDNLNFTKMLDFEFNRLFSPPASAAIGLQAEKFAEYLQKQLNIGVMAVFSYQAQSDDFSSYVAVAQKSAFGLFSRTMMKNLLIFYGSETKNPDLANSRQKSLRFNSYLQSLLATTGEPNLKPRQTMAAISGKPGFGRLILYYLPFSGKPGVSSGHLLIIRELDIPVRQMLLSTSRRVVNRGFKRLITSTSEGLQAIYNHNPEHLEFNSSSDEGISLRALPSGDLLLRIVTDGSLYPKNLVKIIERLPVLKVVAPPPVLAHPLRSTMARTRVAGLILVLFATIIILRIHLFGFGGNLKIGPRLFLSFLAASILPFSTFIAAAAWHQQFLEDFSRAEISQFIQLHADQINRSIGANLSARELQLADLGKTLGNLEPEAAIALLKKWLPENAASLVVYNHDGNEETIAHEKTDKLNDLEADMKDLGFTALRNALKPVGPDGVSNEQILGLINFKSKNLGLVLETIGTLHNAISNNLGFLFANFPVFVDDKRFAAPSALLLMKFKTRDLLAAMIEENSEMLQNSTHGNYLIQKCFIPLELPTELPRFNRALFLPDFDMHSIMQVAEKTAQTRSASSWSDSNTNNIAVYLHNLNCILIIKATRLRSSDETAYWSTFQIIIYFLLVVGTLVAFLRKTLVEPIHVLKKAAEKVAAGDYSQVVDFRSGDEFEPLTNAFNGMTAGLLQKERLSSYVSAEVMQEVEAESGVSLQPGGERIEVSVLFISLSGLKDFRKNSSPEKVTEAMSSLIDTASSIVGRFNGNIDKLIEDTLMLVFRQQSSENGHVMSACRAALEISHSFALNTTFKLWAGIASGPAVSGKIGSKHGKLDFTVIGNPVNLAARLKAQAGKTCETGIIVCPTTIRMLKGAARLRFIERTEIKGRSRTFPLYELLELR
ncbi:MAG: adenylate/guanylate cyclase domain-containing protein [Candidatus Riflebacteria bacterium]|nr:adenylate/guanylate cyclase domain-containing protein [Candidatus Riflebacteria bacterium]